MPDTLEDFAAREPSPAERGRFRPARLIVTANVVLVGLLLVLSFAGVAEVTGISAYLGTFFLVGALVPSNLLRFEQYASGRGTQGARTHLMLIGAGLFAAALIYIVL